MIKILVAIDGSALSLEAVRHVIALNRSGLKTSVLLANVQEPATLYEMVVTRDPELIASASLEAGEHLLASAQALLDEAAIGYQVQISVGEPAPVLVELAETEGCDMVVMGARGFGALGSVLIGSVSKAVAHASAVPVTIVKHSTQDAALTGSSHWQDAPLS